MAVTDAFPADWPRVPFRDVVKIQAGPSSLAKELLPPGETGTPVLSPGEIGWFGVAAEAARSVSPDSAGRLERFGVRAGDLVCVRTGDLGRAALVEPAQEGWILGTSCLRLTLTAPVDPGYVLRYLAHPEVRAWIKENARYSTIPSLSTQVLGDLPFAVAPSEFQTAVGDVLGALEEKIAAHRALIAECERLHEWLLPRLMSGRPLDG